MSGKGMTDRDVTAVAYLLGRLRNETYGCGSWDQAGIAATVAKFVGQNLEITLDRCIRHTVDPDAKTPGAMLRPFLPPATADKPKPVGALTRREQCTRCGGRLPDCGCTRERFAADHDDDRPQATTRPRPGDAAAGIKAARAALHESAATTDPAAAS